MEINNNLAHNTSTFPVCVGDNIALNFLQEADANVLFNLIQKNRTYLRRWLPWIDSIKSYMDEVAFICTAKQQRQENKSLTLGIWYNSKLKGVIGFNQINLDRKTAEIGYWIDEEYQSQGIVTQSCRKLTEMGFRQLGLSAIFISCATENLKSQRIPIRLGFSLYETVKSKEWLYDHYVDHHVYQQNLSSYFKQIEEN